jgi:Anti-sigma factor NepR
MPRDASADRRESPLAASAAMRSGAPDTVPRPLEVNTHVGALLRTMHDSVLNEAVPDRFLELLRQIDDKGDPAAALAEKD